MGEHERPGLAHGKGMIDVPNGIAQSRRDSRPVKRGRSGRGPRDRRRIRKDRDGYVRQIRRTPG